MSPDEKTHERKHRHEETIEDQESQLTSQRSRDVIDTPSFMFKWMQYAASNAYNKDTKPEGIINLGTAENKLCEDILVQKLSSMNKTEGYMNYYFTAHGDKRLALKDFLEDKFNACESLNPDNMVVAAGCGAVFDMLSFALGEEEDYFLSATPHYPRVKNNMGERGRVRIYEVPLTSQLEGDDTSPFQLSARKLHAAYHRATKEGKNIKGIVLLNPNNPLGDAYTEEQLRDILSFAARYKLHVICDEIYGLSVFEEGAKHISVLSLRNIPDPNRVYFMWGFSKDFALAGYRCGMLYTLNQSVLAYCKTMSYYQAVPISIQSKLKALISDKEWTDRVYFPTNLQRIKANFALCQTRLSSLGIPIHPCKGGLFVWINVKKYLGNPATFEAENQLFEEMIANGIYCIPGRAMRCAEPGWLRVIFTVTSEELTEGLNRLEKTILTRDIAVKMQTDRGTCTSEDFCVRSYDLPKKVALPYTSVGSFHYPRSIVRKSEDMLQEKSSIIQPAKSFENLLQCENVMLRSEIEPRESFVLYREGDPEVSRALAEYHRYRGKDGRKTKEKSSVFTVLQKFLRPKLGKHKMKTEMGSANSRMSRMYRSEADLLKCA